jgi:hypothetical protein
MIDRCRIRVSVGDGFATTYFFGLAASRMERNRLVLAPEETSLERGRVASASTCSISAATISGNGLSRLVLTMRAGRTGVLGRVQADNAKAMIGN